MKYLCPICEHELIGKSWCPACKKHIADPWRFDGDTLPNQSSHPVYSYFEDDCGPGHKHRFGIPNVDPHRDRRHIFGRRSRKKHSDVIRDAAHYSAGNYSAANYSSGNYSAANYSSGNYAAPSSASARDSRERVSTQSGSEYQGKYRRPLIIFMVFLIFYIVFTLIGLYTSIFASDSDSSDGADEVVTEAQSITDAGEPCTGYAHYNVMGSDFADAFQVYIYNVWPDAMIDVSAGDINIYTDSDDKTYNEVHQTIYLSYNGLEGYTEVTSDLATGEVMLVKIQSTDPEILVQQTKIAQFILVSGIVDISEIEAEMRIFLLDFQNHYNAGEPSYSAAWVTSVLYMGENEGDPVNYYVYLTCQEEYGKYYTGN